MSKVKNLLFSTCLITICCFITGCWDRVEMEERHFVVAAAIDTADEELKPDQSTEVKRTETFVQPHGGKRYRLSLQVLNLRPGGGDENEKKEEKRTYVISNTGQSLLEMARDLLGQDNKQLWWEHLHTVIISSNVLRETNLKPLFDWFMRDHEMRWRIRVFVTPNEARSLLEYQPPNGEAGGIFFSGIMNNHRKNMHLAGARTDLGWAAQALDNDNDILLPCLELEDKVLKVKGIAAFKRDKIAGYFDDYAIKGTKFLNGTEKSAVITIKCPDTTDTMCVFELFRHDTKLTPHIKDGQIYFTLDIAMVGNINEIQEPSNSPKTTDPKFIRQLELLFAEEVIKNVLYSWKTAQNMGVDAFRLKAKLAAHESAAWEKLKDQWDDIYPTIPLIVSVNVLIRGTGDHK